jgi:hypothetical protein
MTRKHSEVTSPDCRGMVLRGGERHCCCGSRALCCQWLGSGEHVIMVLIPWKLWGAVIVTRGGGGRGPIIVLVTVLMGCGVGSGWYPQPADTVGTPWKIVGSRPINADADAVWFDMRPEPAARRAYPSLPELAFRISSPTLWGPGIINADKTREN